MSNTRHEIQWEWDDVCDDVRVPTISKRGRGCYFVEVVIDQEWPSGFNACTSLDKAKRFAEGVFTTSGAGEPEGYSVVGQKIKWVSADDWPNRWYGKPVEVQL